MTSVLLWKSADDVDACAKCAGAIKKGDNFCESCGERLEWGEERARATTTQTDAKDDALSLKVAAIIRKLRPASRTPGDDIEGELEALVEKARGADEVDALLGRVEGVGAEFTAERARRAAVAESLRVKSFVGGVTVAKSAPAVDAIVQAANRLVKDSGGRLSHAEAHALIEKTSPAEHRRAMAASRSNAVVV